MPSLVLLLRRISFLFFGYTIRASLPMSSDLSFFVRLLCLYPVDDTWGYCGGQSPWVDFLFFFRCSLRLFCLMLGWCNPGPPPKPRLPFSFEWPSPFCTAEYWIRGGICQLVMFPSVCSPKAYSKIPKSYCFGMVPKEYVFVVLEWIFADWREHK